MSFSEYYRENMAAMGLPTPDGIYSGTAAAGATASAILKNAAKYGTKVTVSELIGAGILGESGAAAMGLLG